MAGDKKVAGQKRRRSSGSDDDDGPSTSGRGGEKATIGQLTSGIKNKLKRSEKYAELKHKQKVRLATGCLCC
jgi:hypothetical protein